MIGALIEGAIKRRKVVLGVTLIASIFGLIAYNTMPREANPNIDLPFVAVIVPYPGVSPEDAERLATLISTTLKSASMIKVPSGCAELPLPTTTSIFPSKGWSTMAEQPKFIITDLSSSIGILPFDQLPSSFQLAFFLAKMFCEYSSAMPGRAKLKMREAAMMGLLMVYEFIDILR